MDKLYEAGLTQVFVSVALAAARKFRVKMDSLHLDSSSFHVDGEYASNRDETKEESTAIEITYGYSRDHRPDLKQFIVDLMCSGDGDIPLVRSVDSKTVSFGLLDPFEINAQSPQVGASHNFKFI